jgi:hypothetical protein
MITDINFIVLFVVKRNIYFIKNDLFIIINIVY